MRFMEVQRQEVRLWVELYAVRCPCQIHYVEALTPSTSEYDCTWKLGL